MYVVGLEPTTSSLAQQPLPTFGVIGSDQVLVVIVLVLFVGVRDRVEPGQLFGQLFPGRGLAEALPQDGRTLLWRQQQQRRRRVVSTKAVAATFDRTLSLTAEFFYRELFRPIGAPTAASRASPGEVASFMKVPTAAAVATPSAKGFTRMRVVRAQTRVYRH